MRWSSGLFEVIKPSPALVKLMKLYLNYMILHPPRFVGFQQEVDIYEEDKMSMKGKWVLSSTIVGRSKKRVLKFIPDKANRAEWKAIKDAPTEVLAFCVPKFATRLAPHRMVFEMACVGVPKGKRALVKVEDRLIHDDERTALRIHANWYAFVRVSQELERREKLSCGTKG